MPDIKPKLLDFSTNVYSQFGEDGIIAKIFETIQPESKVCVEFGAWEGFYHSNTANLWTNGWKGVLIEGNLEKFKALRLKTRPYGCICVNEFVRPDGQSSLNSILSRADVHDIDLLSIDVDGDDYAIFASLTVRPRVIICEYNPTIPKNVRMTSSVGSHFGCSSLSLIELAQKMGYSLIAMTDCNCIFVLNGEFTKFAHFETDYQSIAPEKHLTYLITDFSGNYALSRLAPFGHKKPLDIKNIKGELFQLHKTFLGSLRGRSIMQKIINALRAVRNRILWTFNMTSKPPHFVKLNHLKRMAKEYHIDTFIETGTYRGDTLNAVKKIFKKIHSIEIEEKLFRSALKRFAGDDNITLHHGDSGVMLNSLLDALTNPTLFWLDGHYSGGVTGRSDLDTPVRLELSAILNHPIKKHVIAIDDARLFVGLDGYPTVEELKQTILSSGDSYSLKLKDDIIFIIPK